MVYAKSGSTQVDRCVTYNYQSGTWTTGSLARTTWTDASLYDVPYATDFQSSNTPTFPAIQGVTNIMVQQYLCSKRE